MECLLGMGEDKRDGKKENLSLEEVFADTKAEYITRLILVVLCFLLGILTIWKIFKGL